MDDTNQTRTRVSDSRWNRQYLRTLPEAEARS